MSSGVIKETKTHVVKVARPPLGIGIGWNPETNRLIVSKFKKVTSDESPTSRVGPIEQCKHVQIGDSLLSVNELSLTTYKDPQKALARLRGTPMPWSLVFETKRQNPTKNSKNMLNTKRKSLDAVKRRVSQRRKSTKTRRKRKIESPHVPPPPKSDRDILGRIYHTLTNRFQPSYLNVRNMSYWYVLHFISS